PAARVQLLAAQPAPLPGLPAIHPPVAVGVDLHPDHLPVAQDLHPVHAAVPILVVLDPRGLAGGAGEGPDVGLLAPPPRAAHLLPDPLGIVVLPAVAPAVEILIHLHEPHPARSVVVDDVVSPTVPVAVVFDPIQAAHGVVEGLVAAAVEHVELAV